MTYCGIILRYAMSDIKLLLLFVLIGVCQESVFCQENTTCDPTTGACPETAIVSPPIAIEIPTTAEPSTAKPSTAKLTTTKSPTTVTVAPTTTKSPTTTTPITTKSPTTTTPTTTKLPTTTSPIITKLKTTAKPTTTKKLPKGVESPYAGGWDKFTVFAECCWELRLMYYWECDLWLKQCCLNPNITEYRPVCSSTGPGYRMWWKPYRRIFYNECAATKYLCESLPPLTLPWKCMWRRDKDHPHCSGSKKDGKVFSL